MAEQYDTFVMSSQTHDTMPKMSVSFCCVSGMGACDHARCAPSKSTASPEPPDRLQ